MSTIIRFTQLIIICVTFIAVGSPVLFAQMNGSLTLRTNGIFLSMPEQNLFVLNRLSTHQPSRWESLGMRYGGGFNDISTENIPTEFINPATQLPNVNVPPLPATDVSIEQLIEELEQESRESLVRGQVGNYPGNNSLALTILHSDNSTGTDKNSIGYGISATGFMLSGDLMRSISSRVGLFGGYYSSLLNQKNAGSIDANDYQFGGYYQEQINDTDLRCWITYAHQTLESKRYDNASRYDGSTEGDSLSFGGEFSKTFSLTARMFLKPYFACDQHYGWQFGYEENESQTGGTSVYGALKYGRLHMAQSFVRVGANVKYESFNWLTAAFGIQYAYLFAGESNPYSTATQISTPANSWHVKGADVGSDFLNFTSSLQCSVGKARNRYVYGNYDVQMSMNRTVQVFSLGYIEKF
ncbi:MAG: autotransporter outer membrane beta-barrel domain-containing protein [Planctomycetaceae bacterium]|jgi:hypothetical protein|nr:autotransporter outer membrane beta-barrel domain-containing protein [Planctomycetaceae bacterium]